MNKISLTVIGVVLVLCCGGAVIKAITNKGDTGKDTVTSQPSTPRPTYTTSAATSATVDAQVPDLPQESAEHIGLKSAQQAEFLGLPAYSVTLTTGAKIWAVRGMPTVVIPKAKKHSSYNENGSIFLQSGPYVIYVPNMSDTPEGFMTHVGPRPGMTVIDADAFP